MEEFKEVFDEEYYDWLAQYMVMKRASIEANYHPLYLSFMDTLSNTKLNKAILRETYRNIKVHVYIVCRVLVHKCVCHIHVCTCMLV